MKGEHEHVHYYPPRIVGAHMHSTLKKSEATAILALCPRYLGGSRRDLLKTWHRYCDSPTIGVHPTETNTHYYSAIDGTASSKQIP
jgi:hypothetical protein